MKCRDLKQLVSLIFEMMKKSIMIMYNSEINKEYFMESAGVRYIRTSY